MFIEDSSHEETATPQDAVATAGSSDSEPPKKKQYKPEKKSICQNLWKELFSAFESEATDDTIVLILRRITDINWQDENGLTLLSYVFDVFAEKVLKSCTHSSCDWRNWHRIPFLVNSILDMNPNINLQDRKGKSALHYIFNDYRHVTTSQPLTSIIKRMLTMNPDLNLQDEKGNTPFTYALEANPERMDVYKILNRMIDMRPNIHLFNNTKGESALFFVARMLTSPCPKVELIVQRVLDMNPDINFQRYDGKTVLMHSFYLRSRHRSQGYQSKELDKFIVQILSMNPDLNLQDQNGDTTLMHALMYETPAHVNMVKRILNMKPDMNIRNNKGQPALIVALDRNKKVLSETIFEALAKLDTFTKQDINRIKQSALPEKIKNKILKIPVLRNITKILIEEIRKTKQPPFKWQSICREFGNNNLETLKELAKIHGINPGNMSKRQLCQVLAIQTENLKIPEDCANETSILGDDIKDIPPYLLYSFEENGKRYCFNIVELIEYTNRGNTTNPFTRMPLDVNKIKDRFDILKKMLNENALEMVNIIEQIKNNPIMDKKTNLQLAITNLTAGMSYSPTVEQVMGFSKDQLKHIIEYVNSNPIFPHYRGGITLENVMSFLTGAITGENRDLKLVALEQYFLDVLSSA
jgi:ankyrin repeat protein